MKQFPRTGKGPTYVKPYVTTLVTPASTTYTKTQNDITGATGTGIYGPNTLYDALPASNVFDNNNTTSCRMELSPLAGCWFGWDFGVGNTKTSYGFTVIQYNNAARAITEVKYQYSNNMTDWIDIGTTYTIPVNGVVNSFDTGVNTTARAFRILANSTNVNSYWEPMEFQFLETIISNNPAVYSASGEPTNPDEGDTWFDPYRNQFYIFNGITWKLLFQDFGGLYGYNAAGQNGATFFSSVERVSFPFDSGVSPINGSLSFNSYWGSGFNSTVYGYICHSGVNGAYSTQVERLTFPDCSSAILVSNTTAPKSAQASCNSSQQGFVFGGYNAGVGTVNYSWIDSLVFALDTAAMVSAGTVSVNKREPLAVNSSLHGYVMGGYNGSGGVSTIDKMVFGTTGTTTAGQTLTTFTGDGVSINSSVHGYFVKYGTDSKVERISYPWAGGTATYVGAMSRLIYLPAGFNSSQYGYVCGGQPTTVVTNISRFSFPFDSGVSSEVGNTSQSKVSCVGFDCTDFLSQFL
jgi:hypothetical protein